MSRLDYIMDVVALVILMATLYGFLIICSAIESGAL